MSLRKSAPTPVSGTSSGNSRVRVSGSVAAGRRSSWVVDGALMRCRGSSLPAGSCGWKEFRRVDGLAEATNFEMKLDLVGVGVAHLADLLSLADRLSFLDQNLAVVRVRGKIGLVVLADHQLAVAAQARSGVNDSTGGARQHRLTGLAANVDALEIRAFRKSRDNLA